MENTLGAEANAANLAEALGEDFTLDLDLDNIDQDPAPTPPTGGNNNQPTLPQTGATVVNASLLGIAVVGIGVITAKLRKSA